MKELSARLGESKEWLSEQYEKLVISNTLSQHIEPADAWYPFGIDWRYLGFEKRPNYEKWTNRSLKTKI